MDATGYCLVQWEASEPGPGGRGSIAHAASVWRLLRNLFDVESGVPPHYGNEVGARSVVLTDTSAGESTWVATSIGPSVAPGAVWAQSMGNLLGSGGIRAVTPTHDLYVTFLLAFVGAFLALSFSGLVRSLFGSFIYVASLALVFTAYVLYARHLYVDQHRWVAMAGPLAALLGSFGATTLYALRTEAEMYDFVYGALGRYVSPKVARQVLRNVALMRPERRTVSVCYTDLEGFGRMLDALSPEDTVTLLNEYLTEITAVVRQHGGQVEYAGDAVLAFFGAPLKNEKHAQAACAAALGLRAALLARQPDWEKRFGHKVDCRTGVCSGEVLAGDLGSRLKSNYTVMGEPVTLARRLEGANRTYATHLLVADATQSIASDEFVFREADLVNLRGAPVRLYELVERREAVTPEMLGRLAQFDTALRHYRGRRFQEALPMFRELAEHDSVARVYLERTQQYLANPPPSDWSGLGDLRKTQTRA